MLFKRNPILWNSLLLTGAKNRLRACWWWNDEKRGNLFYLNFLNLETCVCFSFVIEKWALLSGDNAIIHPIIIRNKQSHWDNEMIILSSWDDVTMATLRSCVVQKIHLHNNYFLLKKCVAQRDICCSTQKKQGFACRTGESSTVGDTAGEGVLFMFSQHNLGSCCSQFNCCSYLLLHTTSTFLSHENLRVFWRKRMSNLVLSWPLIKTQKRVKHLKYLIFYIAIFLDSPSFTE